MGGWGLAAGGWENIAFLLALRAGNLFPPLAFPNPQPPSSQQKARFVHDAEQQLRDGERLPMSTEILESTFGLYKQLERQHSKSGFTS